MLSTELQQCGAVCRQGLLLTCHAVWPDHTKVLSTYVRAYFSPLNNTNQKPREKPSRWNRSVVLSTCGLVETVNSQPHLPYCVRLSGMLRCSPAKPLDRCWHSCRFQSHWDKSSLRSLQLHCPENLGLPQFNRPKNSSRVSPLPWIWREPKSCGPVWRFLLWLIKRPQETDSWRHCSSFFHLPPQQYTFCHYIKREKAKSWNKDGQPPTRWHAGTLSEK